MSFFRIKTVKGKQYLYKQTSVRDGEKVSSVMEYWGRVDGRDPPQRETNRNSDLQATQNPKRPDYAMEHRKELSKTEKAEHLHAIDMIDEKSDRETKAAWKEKNMSRAEKNKSRGDKQDRVQAKQAADAKWNETMEAVKAFNEARAAERERPSSPSDGSKSSKL